jgi:DNA-binding HxlR family transcriptional regulator
MLFLLVAFLIAFRLLFYPSITSGMWVQEGVDRPGAITRSLDGLTTKVLNACLHKMVDFDILERIAFPEVPPRVEYKFTQFGLLFLEILDKVRELEKKRHISS